MITGFTRDYKDELGIAVGSTKLPDPTKMSYQVGDLDTSGSRDATGLLHRAYVATKINYELQWTSLGWDMLQHILTTVNASPKFQFTAPDPRTFLNLYTGYYYVGDRTGDVNYFLPNKEGVAEYSLKLKFIEY